MKATIFILTALFVMNFTFLSAGNPKIIIIITDVKTNDIGFNNSDLAPVTPKEAFFNDVEPIPIAGINHLAPITPQEATFEDIKPELQIESLNPLLLQQLVPKTPKEAGFDDSSIDKITEIDPLAPISPLVAAFEE